MILRHLAYSSDARWLVASVSDDKLIYMDIGGNTKTPVTRQLSFLSCAPGYQKLLSVMCIDDHIIALVYELCMVLLDVLKDSVFSASRDPDCVIGRIALPCNCLCAVSYLGGILVGSKSGTLIHVSTSGRVLSRRTLKGVADISSVVAVSHQTILVGSDNGSIILYDWVNDIIKSAYSHHTMSKVSQIRVDSQSNWFVAVLPSFASTSSHLVVGSTKSLVSVFEESGPHIDVAFDAQFVSLPNHGLCVLVTGSTPLVRLLSLDLTSVVRRIELHGMDRIFALTSSNNRVAIGGIGELVALINTSTHSISYSSIRNA